MRRGFHDGPSTRLRNASFALFVGGVLAYGAAFAWYMLDRFDLVSLIQNVTLDDSFYYFQIAHHLAEGGFSTFDGGITRTNGYHPLWLLLITPFYWFFDKTEALFAIKAFEIMLVAGGVALLACAARVARLPWILLFAAPPALYGNPYLFRGLEAAAGLFMLCLFLLAVCLFARDAARWRWALAAAAFALPWVRLEYAAVAMASTAALCLLERPWRDGPRRAPAAGVPFLAAGAGLLAYFAYNAAVFGGIVPVSGATKRWWSLRFWEQEGGYSLTENFHAFLQLGIFGDELPIAAEVCVYVVVVWWFSRRTRGLDDRLLLAFLVGLFGLAAGHLAKFAQNVLTVTVWNGSAGWYFVPAYLMGVLIVPARCCVAIWFVRRVLGPGLRRASRIPSLGIAAAGAVFLFAAADFAAPFRFVDRDDVYGGEWMVSAYAGTMAMNRVLPDDSVVGSWDAGVVGYFSRFPVMNLDGLANSWDYLRAQKEGTEAAFLQRRRITHLANFQSPVPGGGRHHDTRLFEGPRFLLGEQELRFMVWPAERADVAGRGGGRDGGEVDRSGLFRERMKPHFERETDGVGLLVDGRLAQAFAWDCAPDELAVWTSGPAGRVEAVGAWTQTAVGFCTSSIVAPHDAAPPVRAASMTRGEYLADRFGGRPAIESDFDVYLAGNTLTYVKEQCGEDDVDAQFFLHVVPVDPDDLPGPRGYGFDRLDFGFAGRGATFDGACLVEVPLPEYGIAAIRTGQHEAAEGGFRHLWEGEIRPHRPSGSPRRSTAQTSGPRGSARRRQFH